MAKSKKESKARKCIPFGEISNADVQKIIKETTKDAESKRLNRFRKRFASTAPAPKFMADPNKDGTISLRMESEIDALTEACGTANLSFANDLVNDIIGATCHSHDPSEINVANSAVAALAGMAAKDETEAMLAAQTVATHKAAMKMLGRAMRAKQLDVAQWQSNFAIKLLRTCPMLIEAMARYRGHGQQTVRVEHVTVNAGGQAIVGNVNPVGGGGAQQKLEEQPHATAIEYQPASTVSALPCSNPQGNALPVPSDAKR